MSGIRACLLQIAFELLYGPLVFLHEPLGRLAFGPAWQVRRSEIARLFAGQPAPTLELGCGEGRLLGEVRASGERIIGLDLSRHMLRRAASRSSCRPRWLVQADSRRLPIQTSSIGRVLVSYPGPWIANPATWDELARVCVPGTRIVVLLGGDYRRGPLSSFRRFMAGIAYGAKKFEPAGYGLAARLAHPAFKGELKLTEDRWGTAALWIAYRCEDIAGP